MRTLIINGSPKGNTEKCACFILARAFVGGMKTPCEILSLAREPRELIYKKMEQADRIILFTPNYIHLFPAGVLDFLQKLPEGDGKRALFMIIQSGYPEAKESEIACRLFRRFCEKRSYQCGGTLIKGEGAGIGIMPNMFKKLYLKFAVLGGKFEQNGEFDKQLKEEFETPYVLKRSTECLLNFTAPLSKIISWDSFMRKNHCYRQRRATPYLK